MPGCYETYYTNDGPKRCVPEQECPSCRIGGLQQEVSLFRTLLEEVLNEVPHGWGESFSESELAERIRDALEESTE